MMKLSNKYEFFGILEKEYNTGNDAKDFLLKIQGGNHHSTDEETYEINFSYILSNIYDCSLDTILVLV